MSITVDATFQKFQYKIFCLNIERHQTLAGKKLIIIYELFGHRLRITIDTTNRGFLSAHKGVAVVFIFQKFHSKQGSLRLFHR
jgi:hypothetical protein